MGDATGGLRPKDPLVLGRTNALTWDEFQSVLAMIDGTHGIDDMTFDDDGLRRSWKGIKYVRPMIDLRDNRVYRVEFIGLCGSHDKPTVFDERDEGGRMLERIARWLKIGGADDE